jgi:hypothetical protein
MGGSAAIFTDRVKATHIIRKVLLPPDRDHGSERGDRGCIVFASRTN